MHAIKYKRRRPVSRTHKTSTPCGPHDTRTLRRVPAAKNAPSSASREPTPALAATSAPLRSATSLAAKSQCRPASANLAVTGAPSSASAAVAASVSRGISAREARRGPHRHFATRARMTQTDEPSHLSTCVHRHHHRGRRRRPNTARMLVPCQGCLRHTAVQHSAAACGRRRLHSIRGSSLAT